ncbi:helix-turn-helix domain-containing protein [Streptomyces bullii]|uniref:Helix-turn-helix domain-containing protein n=1 Tax=Streptomyces bullii TaxID=349910 RepID=A0ABW0UXL7_9ACTN
MSTLAAERLDLGAAQTHDPDAATPRCGCGSKAFIDRHLGHPDLSPRTIAAAHHLSARQVHRLFEAQGTTVSRWLQHRRLEACAPDADGLVVAAVANCFGFAGHAHFSRVARRPMGCHPVNGALCGLRGHAGARQGITTAWPPDL